MTISPGFSDLPTALEDFATVGLELFLLTFGRFILTLFQSKGADYAASTGLI
jgi:hypothetical protein